MPRLDFHEPGLPVPPPHGHTMLQDWHALLLHEVNLLRRHVGLPERTMTDVAEMLVQLRAEQPQDMERTT